MNHATKTVVNNKEFSQNKGIGTLFQLSTRLSLWLIACQLLALVALFAELKLWLLAIIVICLSWRTLIVLAILPKPTRVVVLFLSIAGCVLLMLTARTLGLLLSMVHLLCLAYVLKSFELNKRADFYQLVLLGLFVVCAALIFSQSIYFSLLIIAVVVMNLALLLGYFAPSLGVLTINTLTSKLILQSIPLAVLLFLFFPKISPFWQVPMAKSATTGLSDSVRVGDIAELALSDALAFRIDFDGAVPNYSQLYWRTLVLESFDGQAWRADKLAAFTANNATVTPFVPPITGAALPYQIIAAKSFQHWLYALDVAKAEAVQANNVVIIQHDDFTLTSKKPLTQTMSYRVESYLHAPLALKLSSASRAKNLRFPAQSNPRLTKAAAELRQQYLDDQSLINAVLARFTRENYRYTLKPPQLNNNSLDQFYFDTQAGFCEHYASTFTYLMRAAGIPARLVTGYLGAEYNPQGNYYSVLQRDAHAWSEVWLVDQGWVRIDPTAAVNPARIERGFSDSLLQEQSALNNQFFTTLRFKQSAWLNALRYQFEALDFHWTKWVLGYSAQRQFNVMAALFGQHSLWKTGVLTTASCFVILLFLWFVNKTSKGKQPSELRLVYYQQALEQLARKGLLKPNMMAAKDFEHLVTQTFPEIAPCFSKLTLCFLQLSYQANPENGQLAFEAKMKKQLQLLKKGLKTTNPFQA